MTREEKLAEEAKRERNWETQRRWQAIQAAIKFADAQQPISRNSKERCLELQRKHDMSQH